VHAVLVCYFFRLILWNPIGQHIHNQIRIHGVIRFEMNRKVMGTIHAFVHHEDIGLNDCAFTRLEYHRTYGKLRRLAPLQYFDIWFIFEIQCAIAGVGDFGDKDFIDAEFHIAVINHLLIYCNGWGSTAIAGAIMKVDISRHDKHKLNVVDSCLLHQITIPLFKLFLC